MRFMQPKQKLHFNIGTLKKNDIVILTLDERWNKLFKIIPISNPIKKRQDRLNKLLGKEASLFQEQKRIEPEKKKHMNRIILLSQEAFEKNNDEAKKSLSESKQRIEQLNKRSTELENELFIIGNRIREANFQLLEETVRYVYKVIAKSREKERKIEREVERLKKRLRDLQAERQSMSAGWVDVYAFFHDLLGSDELTKLDNLFMKREGDVNETGKSQ